MESMLKWRALVGLGVFLAGCTVDVPPLDSANAFACRTNADCVSGFVCDSTALKCKPATSHEPCAPEAAAACLEGASLACRDDECVPCNEDIPCPDGAVCAAHSKDIGGHRCLPLCASDAGCSSGDPCAKVIDLDGVHEQACLTVCGCPDTSCVAVEPEHAQHFDEAWNCSDCAEVLGTQAGEVHCLTPCSDDDACAGDEVCRSITDQHSVGRSVCISFACDCPVEQVCMAPPPESGYASVEHAQQNAYCECEPIANGWESLGGSGCGAGITGQLELAENNAATHVSLILDAANRPWVAWTEDETPPALHIAKFEAGSWQPVEPPNEAWQNFTSQTPLLARLGATVGLAWLQEDNDDNIRKVRHAVWQGELWDDVTLFPDQGHGHAHSLAYAGDAVDGYAPVVWLHGDEQLKVVRRYPDGGWTDLALYIVPEVDASIHSPAAAIDGSKVAVAFEYVSSPGAAKEIWVAPDVSTLDFDIFLGLSPAERPAIAMTPAQEPLVVWQAGDPFKIYASTKRDQAWQPWSTSADIIECDEACETVLNEPSATQQTASVAVTSTSSAAIVAWTSKLDVESLFVRQSTTGGQWSRVGDTHSDAGLGLSPYGKATNPSVAVGDNGQVCVAWIEANVPMFTRNHVFLRCTQLVE